MKVCIIYSGWLRTWDRCRQNHETHLLPAPAMTIHYSEFDHDLRPYAREDWEHYRENKAPETEPENTMNMWHNMYEAWRMAPPGLDCYVRNRYDIIFHGVINFADYEMTPNRVYIPTGGDYREGVNDQFAFGSYTAMEAYFDVYYDHAGHFAQGRMFHSESYLHWTLKDRGFEIVRIPQTNEIIR